MLSGEIFAFWKTGNYPSRKTALLIITSSYKQLHNRYNALCKDIHWATLKIIEVFKAVWETEATAQLPSIVRDVLPLHIGAQVCLEGGVHAVAVEKATPFESSTFQAWVRMDKVSKIFFPYWFPTSKSFQTRMPIASLAKSCYFTLFKFLSRRKLIQQRYATTTHERGNEREPAKVGNFAGHLTANRFLPFAVWTPSSLSVLWRLTC